MRFPRMTTRRWMIAVAVVAALSAFFVWMVSPSNDGAIPSGAEIIRALAACLGIGLYGAFVAHFCKRLARAVAGKVPCDSDSRRGDR
jgi:hypothetical protein